MDRTVWSNLVAGPFTALESIGLFLLGSSQRKSLFQGNRKRI
nr:unnamed protein product [Callosobruchus chinensis]CAH7740440.1 unnamed protein product [Callosobruchus chinensis]CAH7751678.1 unnamed protein product [Callosobruchus chinensis]